MTNLDQSYDHMIKLANPHFLDSEDCPVVWRDALDQWTDGDVRFVHGDDCMRAFVRNDLKTFFAQADQTTLLHAYAIFKYAYNRIPSRCWGSAEKYDKWLEDHS